MRVNSISDWTDEEYAGITNGAVGHGNEDRLAATTGWSSKGMLNTTDLKDHIDWR